MPKIGYLLINLGTPASPSVTDARAYLNEFLMDPYVIDLPWLARRLLVSLTILPFRPHRSAEAYAKIWTEEGSPLLCESASLAAKLRQQLAAPVELAMRYGKPSIATAVQRLEQQSVDQIVVAPLYPQYADSTVTTSLKVIKALNSPLPIQTLAPFYKQAAFINPLREIVGKHLQDPWDHLLLSFHGLPEQHITRTDPTGNHCLTNPNCCKTPADSHATCYRHQVYETARHLTQALAIADDKYTVSFQSRLGRLPWLQPYTDQILAELPARGVKRLVVACPAFVADNLETLEEMGIQGRATFLAAGGESFTLVPCLNDHPLWIKGLAELLENQTVAANSLTSS